MKIINNIKYILKFHLAPKAICSDMFRGFLGYDMDWKNPQDYNEKINWMKFNYDTSEWTRLADKIRVRDYVKERIGEEVLPEIYGIWKKAEEIDFDALPSKFVLKTNHGCGTVIPVPDKSKLDIKQACQQLNAWAKQKFGYYTVEPHYLKIKPLIYAEELLENDADFSSSLVDYKVFCLGGKPYCILVCSDRLLGKHTNLTFYDLNWNQILELPTGKHLGESKPIPKPDCLNQLLDCAEKLAAGHPQIRVDFYIVLGKIYFGEMTFTSQGGFMDYISREYSLKMGQLIPIP